MRGTLTIQHDTGSDPYFDQYMETVSLVSYFVVVFFHICGATHRRTKGILLFFQKTRRLQSAGVVTIFHLFTIAIYGRNCFDMQY